MSAKKEEPKAAPADAKAEPAKKKPPIKLIGMIAGIMVAEAIAVFVIFKAIAPKTPHAEAKDAHVESSDADMVKELKVLEDKFQNMKEGRAWIWDLSVAIQTRKKHGEKVEAVLKSREGEIKQEIGRMVANADHNQLASPDRETLSRQVTAFLVKLIGNDEKTNDPLVEKVLIPRCRGFPAEF
jgi:flagellar basal body-associated protein FliL